MRRRLRLRERLLLGHLLVVVVATGTLFLTVGLVTPGAFDAAMGHSMAGMGEMMNELVRSAFQQAVRSALVVAAIAAAVTAVVASAALAIGLARPIRELARASRRIASGRYAERVPVTPGDEIAELGESFNAMAASLEATERRRLGLVGDVTHELRTPLATLDGYLEGLEDGVIAPTEATWKLLRTETARLSRLVDDLQELWRAEARQLPLSTTEVGVREALAAAARRFEAQARGRGIELRVGARPGRLAVRADAERLAQILDNFLSNALRYSPDGGTVTLSAAEEDDRITMGVTDQGPGLSEDQRERVFERFYRVDASRSRTLGGSGIGLTIARALAEAMGGRAWAESAGPGRGSTFHLALPRGGHEPH